MPLGLQLLLGAIVLFVVVWFATWLAAQAAGEHPAVSMWWGVLGPVGWLIAALRGVQERIEDGRDE